MFIGSIFDTILLDWRRVKIRELSPFLVFFVEFYWLVVIFFHPLISLKLIKDLKKILLSFVKNDLINFDIKLINSI